MPPLPMLKAREVISALQKAGFAIVRQQGGHVRLRHQDGRVVTVPFHSSQDIGRGLLRKIMRDAEISPDDLARLLRD